MYNQFVPSTNKQLTTVDLPNVTTVGKEAFSGCSVLENVNLPNAQFIGRDAFYMCMNLAKLSLPKVTVIDIEAFDSCSALKELDSPSVTAVGRGILQDTNKSVEIVRLPATPPRIQTTSFNNVVNDACVFYIPRGSLAAYQSATNWSTLTGKYSFVEEDR